MTEKVGGELLEVLVSGYLGNSGSVQEVCQPYSDSVIWFYDLEGQRHDQSKLRGVSQWAKVWKKGKEQWYLI